MQSCILSKFSRQFTSSREAGGTTDVFPEEEEEEAAQYVSSDNDISEEDEEECFEQEAEFSVIGAHERPFSPVREANGIYPEEPTRKQNLQSFHQVWIIQKVLTELMTLHIDCPVFGAFSVFVCFHLFIETSLTLLSLKI